MLITLHTCNQLASSSCVLQLPLSFLTACLGDNQQGYGVMVRGDGHGSVVMVVMVVMVVDVW